MFHFINLFKILLSSTTKFEMRGLSWTVLVRDSWGMLSSVHHLSHVGHPLWEERGVVQVT